MTGAQHYKEAERLLGWAATDLVAGHSQGNLIEHDTQVARAQVHATLALAAAVAYKPIQDYVGEYDATDGREWSQVISS